MAFDLFSCNITLNKLVLTTSSAIYFHKHLQNAVNHSSLKKLIFFGNNYSYRYLFEDTLDISDTLLYSSIATNLAIVEFALLI